MYTAIIPDPDYFDGNKRKEIYGDNPTQLCIAIREWIMLSGYGASDIGANFSVYRDGNIVGDATYNGKMFWRDPAYKE